MPSLIGLSPLATGHPLLFQQEWVRPSSACYRTFSLPMARSPGFGSHPSDSGRPIKTRFRYASAYRLKLATETNSLTHYTKGTRSRIRRGRSPAVPLPLLVGIRFQVSFTPLIGVLFTFPSRYLFAIGRQGVLRLGGWSPHVQTGLHVSRLTQGSSALYPYGAVTRSGRSFQTVPVICTEPLAYSAFARHY